LRFRSESGSAVVEFVLLAVPLFLPLIVFVSQFSELSAIEISSRTLVREAVRAYVSAIDESDARMRAGLVLDYAARRLGFSEMEISNMQISYSCSAEPCFSAGTRVRATLRIMLPGENRRVQVSAQEFVSPWQ